MRLQGLGGLDKHSEAGGATKRDLGQVNQRGLPSFGGLGQEALLDGLDAWHIEAPREAHVCEVAILLYHPQFHVGPPALLLCTLYPVGGLMRVTLTWAPTRPQRGPYTGRGARTGGRSAAGPAGLLDDQMLLDLFL